MAILVTDASSEPFAAAAAKIHLRETLASGDNDTYITGLIKIARKMAQDRTGRSILPTTWKLVYNGFPSIIVLEHPPVTAVSSIVYVDSAGATQTLAPSAYQVAIAQEPGRIVPAYGTCWPSTRCQPEAVTVTYVAGYANAAAIPDGIVHWMKLAVADMYENRSRSGEPTVARDFAEDLLNVGNTVWGV